MSKSQRWVWVARGLIAVVTFWNLHAAIQFLVTPERFAGGFELSGTAGEAMLRGMGLLFVMWNVPYVFALIDPLCNRTSLVEAVIMQFIGVAGESLLLILLAGQHAALQQTVWRFITFDGAGFLALIAAWRISAAVKRQIDSASVA